MGRTKYSQEMRDAIMAAFVSATRKIIDEEGIDAVSIRHVSTTAGYSSGTLYLYFEDMNELVTMSLVSHLDDYAREVVETTPDEEAPNDSYRRTWEIFCKHAFAHPTEFLNLFFGPRSADIGGIVKKYYELFPDELKNATGNMLTMLEEGDLAKRNRVVLESFAVSFGLSAYEIDIANDLTIAYFHSFLRSAAERELTEQELIDFTNRFMEGAYFILHGPGNPRPKEHYNAF